MSKQSLSGRGRRPMSLCTPRQSPQGSSSSSRGGNSSSCTQALTPSHENLRRERDALRAELEAERLRSQEARRRFTIEARELREVAQRNQQLQADKLRSKWEKEQLHQLQRYKEETKRQRDAEIRDLLRWKRAELDESREFLKQERDAAVRQARDLQCELAKQLVIYESSCRGTSKDCSDGTECRAKIKEVLAKLRWDVDGDQAVRIRHLEAQLELERRLVQKYILDRSEGEPLLTGSLPRFHQASSPPEGKVSGEGAAGERAQEGLPQPGKLPGDSNTDLKILEGKNPLQLVEIQKQCESLRQEVEEKQKLLQEALAEITREEKTLLKKSSFPDMEDQVNILQRKCAELASIAQRLQEAAEKLQESHRSRASEPLAQNCSDPELWEKMLAQQQATPLKVQASQLLAKDQQIGALQKELQAKRSSSQTALSSQRDTLQTSRIAAKGSSSSPILQETSTTHECFKDSLAKKKPKAWNISKKDAEPQASSVSPKAKKYKTGGLKRDSKSPSHSEVLEKQRECEKQKVSENLRHEVEETQDRWQEAELKLLSENARLSGENSQLREQNMRAQKMALAALLELQRKEDTIKGLQEVITRQENFPNMEEIVNILKRKQAELSAIAQRLQKEAMKLQEFSLRVRHTLGPLALDCCDRELWEKVSAERASVKVLNEQASVLLAKDQQIEALQKECQELQAKLSLRKEKKHSLTNTRDIDSLLQEYKSEAVQLQRQIDLMSQRGSLQTSRIAANGLEDSLAEKKTKALNGSMKDAETQTLPFSDKEGELDGWETDNLFIQLQSDNLRPFQLRCFLARYSYDPFNSPNKNPEAYLPLTAGEYVYICGGMDEDGFYVGELMDGRRGFVPSNLIEEVEDNDLFSFLPLEASGIFDNSDYESDFSSQSASCEEKSDSPDDGLPHPPIGVQVEAGSSADILVISWLPETIHSSGLSNGVKVTGYAIYIGGQKATEIMSPTAGSISLEVSQINQFPGAQTVSVRTLSPFGESADSMPATIPSDLLKSPSAVLAQSVASELNLPDIIESEGRPIQESEDMDKNRSKACLTPNRIHEGKPENTKGYGMAAKDSSSQSSLENCDANSLSPEPRSSSPDPELIDDADAGVHDVCFQDIFLEKDHGTQIKQGWKELSKLTVSQVQAHDAKTFSSRSWLFSVGDYSPRGDLSDIEEEKEEDQENQGPLSGEDACEH